MRSSRQDAVTPISLKTCLPVDNRISMQRIAELHAIATRALANGDDYARALLREQLEEEEFSERSEIAPGAE